MSEATDEEAVMAWAKENKISEDCGKLLLKDGFTSMEALGLLQPEDVNHKIPRGQNRLILQAVGKLATPQTKEGEQESGEKEDQELPEGGQQNQQQQQQVPPTDPYITEVMAQLQRQQIPGGAPSTAHGSLAAPSTGSLSWNDPQVFIKMAAGKAGEVSTHYDITDFVNLSGAVVREEVVGNGATGAQLVWRTGPQKPKLSSLSTPQWSVANLAILARLKGDGKLDSSATMDYLSYNTRVYQLLQRYEAVSVFLYDREYRKLQAQLGFRWGTEVTHLQAIWLKEQDHRSSTSARSVTSVTNKFTGAPNKPRNPVTVDGKTICKMYNTQSGCTYNGCTYMHVCSRSGCEQKHSAVHHDTPKN